MADTGFIPAGTDLSGLQSIDFTNRSSHQQSLFVTSVVFIVVIFLTVSLRVFTRVYFVKTLFIDDSMSLYLFQVIY